MAKHRGLTLEPEVTNRDVFEEVDRVEQKLDRVLNELAEITRKLEKLSSSVVRLQETLDQKP